MDRVSIAALFTLCHALFAATHRHGSSIRCSACVCWRVSLSHTCPFGGAWQDYCWNCAGGSAYSFGYGDGDDHYQYLNGGIGRPLHEWVSPEPASANRPLCRILHSLLIGVQRHIVLMHKAAYNTISGYINNEYISE